MEDVGLVMTVTRDRFSDVVINIVRGAVQRME